MPGSTDDRRLLLRFLSGLLVRLLIAALLSAPLLGWYVDRLHSVGECLPDREIARLGRAEPILWMSGFHADGARKPGIAAELAPSVAVIGSSRVMQFRHHMFNEVDRAGFYNLGGCAYDMLEAHLAVDRLLAGATDPDLLIIGIDWWWFQGTDPGPRPLRERVKSLLGPEATGWLRDVEGRLETDGEFWLDELQVVQGAWRDERFLDALAGDPVVFSKRSGRRMIGIGPRQAAGFRNDGSVSYEKMVPVLLEHEPTAEEVRGRFVSLLDVGTYPGNDFLPGGLVDLGRIARACEARGIDLIITLPPLETGAYEAFRSRPESSRFWGEFARRIGDACDGLGVPFFDATDMTPHGIDFRHFIDAYHVGEVGTARWILAMGADEAIAPVLTRYVDLEALAAEIEGAVNRYEIRGD